MCLFVFPAPYSVINLTTFQSLHLITNNRKRTLCHRRAAKAWIRGMIRISTVLRYILLYLMILKMDNEDPAEFELREHAW